MHIQDLSQPPFYDYFPNIMADRVPPTPATGLPRPDQDHEPANIILREEIARRGYSIMITEEKQGRQIHDVIPIRGREESYSNEGSAYFPFHVEVPHYPKTRRPDAVILFCMRGTPGAKTLVMDFHKLIPKLQKNSRLMITQREFALNTGESFGQAEKFRTRILHEDGTVTLDMAEMTGLTEQASEALHDIEKTISLYYNSLVTEVELKAGEMLIFNNKRLIHGRNNFSQKITYNGTQRWLKRCYLKKNP